MPRRGAGSSKQPGRRLKQLPARQKKRGIRKSQGRGRSDCEMLRMQIGVGRMLLANPEAERCPPRGGRTLTRTLSLTQSLSLTQRGCSMEPAPLPAQRDRGTWTEGRGAEGHTGALRRPARAAGIGRPGMGCSTLSQLQALPRPCWGRWASVAAAGNAWLPTLASQLPPGKTERGTRCPLEATPASHSPPRPVPPPALRSWVRVRPRKPQANYM